MLSKKINNKTLLTFIFLFIINIHLIGQPTITKQKLIGKWCLTIDNGVGCSMPKEYDKCENYIIFDDLSKCIGMFGYVENSLNKGTWKLNNKELEIYIIKGDYIFKSTIQLVNDSIFTLFYVHGKYFHKSRTFKKTH